MDSSSILKWFGAAIPPLAFLLILWALLESKCSRRTARWTAAGFLAAELALQWVILFFGDSPELVFTLLPLTLYLPAIVCLHLLSKNRLLPTALVWLLALLGDHLLAALRKLLVILCPAPEGSVWTWILAGVLALAAALLLLLVYRTLRAPFLACTRELEGSWMSLLFLPVMLLALSSYLLSSTARAMVLLLLFLTALAAFGVLARLLASLAEERRGKDAGAQMKALRRDYEVLQKKLELGRSYRHDLRHHITALSALLQEGDCGEALRYTAGWQGQLAKIETKTYCRNAAVNGVLSGYLAQAEEAGCAIEAEVTLPGEFPFEETDLCVVLANALENAIHACKAAPEGTPRQIKLNLSLADHRRLIICVENSCHENVKFDGGGFPIVPRREGHGQGLKSIAAVAEKYHGLFRCDCRDGRFILQVVLLDAAGPAPARRGHRVPEVCAGVFLCLFLLNCMPTLAQALEGIPMLGPVIRVVDLRSYSLGWGDSGISVQEPVLEGDAAEEAEARKDGWILQMQERFLWYASRKYQGYAAEDITYDVLRDDGSLFILRFSATLNAGGSVDYSRHIVLNQETGQVLALADLFQSEANYAFPISREIKAQMAERINAGEGDYFLPGGIWPDEECFQSIEDDQDFYINEAGQLIIVFAEYEVAPGSMGAPEFIIPTDALNGLLAQPSVLQ